MSMFSLPQRSTTNSLAPRFNLLDEALSSPSKTTPTSTSTFGFGAHQSDHNHDGKADDVANSVSSTTAQIPFTISGTTSKPSRQPKRETTVASTIPPAATVPVGKGLSKVTLVELMKAMGLMGLSLDDGDNSLPDYTGPGAQSSDEDRGDKEESGDGDGDEVIRETDNGDQEGSVPHQSDHDIDGKDDLAYSVSATTAQIPLTITGTTSILTTKPPGKNTTESIMANLVEAVPSGKTAVPQAQTPQALVAENQSNLETTKSATTNAISTTQAATAAGTIPLVPVTTGTPSTSSTLATTSGPKMTLTTDGQSTSAVSAKIANSVLEEVEVGEVVTTTPMTPNASDSNVDSESRDL